MLGPVQCAQRVKRTPFIAKQNVLPVPCGHCVEVCVSSHILNIAGLPKTLADRDEEGRPKIPKALSQDLCANEALNHATLERCSTAKCRGRG